MLERCLGQENKAKVFGDLKSAGKNMDREEIEVKTEVSNWQGMVLKKIWMYTEGPAKTVLLVNTCKMLSSCRVTLL